MLGANALKRVTAEMTLTRMCDESLNTTNEALLSRIAKLEELVLSGRMGTMSRPEMPEQEQQPIAVQPEKAPVTESFEHLPTKPLPNQAAPESKEGKRVLRAIRGWREVVERLTAQDAMAASFLGNARGYTEGERTVVIRFENEFMLTMIDRGETKDMLRGALSVCLQREVKERDLVCEVVPKEKEAMALDEIIEALDEE